MLIPKENAPVSAVLTVNNVKSLITLQMPLINGDNVWTYLRCHSFLHHIILVHYNHAHRYIISHVQYYQLLQSHQCQLWPLSNMLQYIHISQTTCQGAVIINGQKIYICMQGAIFWDVALCRSCENWCFRGTCHLHLQDRENLSVKSSVSSWLAD
jgi:hypothetical protein